VSCRKEAAEIGITLAVLGEEHQMMRVFGRGGLCRAATGTAGGNRSRAAGSRGFGRLRHQRLHPHLGTEDGLDAALGAGLGEAHGPVEAVVVGECESRLS